MAKSPYPAYLPFRNGGTWTCSLFSPWQTALQSWGGKDDDDEETICQKTACYPVLLTWQICGVHSKETFDIIGIFQKTRMAHSSTWQDSTVWQRKFPEGTRRMTQQNFIQNPPVVVCAQCTWQKKPPSQYSENVRYGQNHWQNARTTFIYIYFGNWHFVEFAQDNIKYSATQISDRALLVSVQAPPLLRLTKFLALRLCRSLDFIFCVARGGHARGNLTLCNLRIIFLPWRARTSLGYEQIAIDYISSNLKPTPRTEWSTSYNRPEATVKMLISACCWTGIRSFLDLDARYPI